MLYRVYVDFRLLCLSLCCILLFPVLAATEKLDPAVHKQTRQAFVAALNSARQAQGLIHMPVPGLLVSIPAGWVVNNKLALDKAYAAVVDTPYRANSVLPGTFMAFLDTPESGVMLLRLGIDTLDAPDLVGTFLGDMHPDSAIRKRLEEVINLKKLRQVGTAKPYEWSGLRPSSVRVLDNAVRPRDIANSTVSSSVLPALEGNYSLMLLHSGEVFDVRMLVLSPDPLAAPVIVELWHLKATNSPLSGLEQNILMQEASLVWQNIRLGFLENKKNVVVPSKPKPPPKKKRRR